MNKIQSWESQLEKEKTVKAQLEDNLNKANDELQQLRKDKESNDRNCYKALKKVEELKMLHDKSQEKVAALEEEKSQLTAAMVSIDMDRHSLSESVKEKEQQLYNFDSTVAKQAAELYALKAKITALKKVILQLNSSYFKYICYAFKFLNCFNYYYRAL